MAIIFDDTNEVDPHDFDLEDYEGYEVIIYEDNGKYFAIIKMLPSMITVHKTKLYYTPRVAQIVSMDWVDARNAEASKASKASKAK